MFQEILNIFLELKKLLEDKKDAIIHKNIDKLNLTDENIIILNEKIQKYDLEKLKETLTEQEKKQLKDLGEKIKVLQENNEILIKHSINVINNILSGILNITAKEKISYDSHGKSCNDSESLDISSITEEA